MPIVTFLLFYSFRLHNNNLLSLFINLALTRLLLLLNWPFGTHLQTNLLRLEWRLLIILLTQLVVRFLNILTHLFWPLDYLITALCYNLYRFANSLALTTNNNLARTEAHHLISSAGILLRYTWTLDTGDSYWDPWSDFDSLIIHWRSLLPLVRDSSASGNSIGLQDVASN